MILIAVFAAGLKWFPIFGAVTAGAALSGWPLVVDRARHLALPLATLTLITIPGTYLIMRYSMLTVLGEQYIATARAKGLAERVVLRRHAVRNALLPVATVFMLNLGFIASGATVTETVFSYPGIGRLLYEAVLNRDYPVLQGTFFIITVSVIAANILADLAYPFIDPRVRRR
jgi:peptide/nickel transport system permease protein